MCCPCPPVTHGHVTTTDRVKYERQPRGATPFSTIQFLINFLIVPLHTSKLFRRPEQLMMQIPKQPFTFHTHNDFLMDFKIKTFFRLLTDKEAEKQGEIDS